MKIYCKWIFLLLVTSCQIQPENFALEQPEVLDPTNIGPYNFRANWKRVAAASHYVLEVKSLEDSNFELTRNDLKDFSFDVIGLEVNELYQYRVSVVYLNGKISLPSEWKQVKTIPLFGVPVAKAATDRTALEFTANWDGIEGINKYIIEVSNVADFIEDNVLIKDTVTGHSERVYNANISLSVVKVQF